jgi:serine/threonine-protein kinase
VETVKYRIRAARAPAEGFDFTVVVLQSPEVREPSVTRETAEVDRDWPFPGRYLQVRRLGRGGMGTVFLVEDGEGRQYALKTLRRDRSHSSDSVERFWREVQLSVALRHPRVVRTYEFDRTPDDLLYMVTEYCPGGSASAWLQRHGPVPVDLALSWMVGVVQALQYAWEEHGLIHRDVKPDNLLLGTSNQVKLADFGIARRIGGEDPRVTQPGMIIGSVHYMAPEQALGEELDVRSDLYALGATMFHLLTGTPPFVADNPATILTHKLRRKSPAMRRQRRGLPRPLASCIDSLLARKPDQRPATPATVRQRLERIAEDEGIELDRAPQKYATP